MSLSRALCPFLAAALLLPACGEGDATRSGSLEWRASPRTFTPPGLPRDRVLLGRVRNRSSDTVRLRAEDVRLVAPDGRRLEADAGFLGGYVKPDESQNRDRDLHEISPAERRRLGRSVELEPGASAPLMVAWRRRPGDPRGSSLDYGDGRLPLSLDR